MVRAISVVLMVVLMAAGLARAQEKAATRVAVLNFGPAGDIPTECDVVGVHITAKAFEDVMPLLEKDAVDVVVLRVKSVGGYLQELDRLLAVFARYKARFRTVVWIEEAIGGGLMSVWGVPEIYCFPKAKFGACTSFRLMPSLVELQLGEMLILMERVSKEGKRDPSIMRAMQIMEPLSADLDPKTGVFTWRRDVLGEHVVNPRDQILTLGADDAVKFKIARAIAADRGEVARAMGIEKVEWVGKEAADAIDRSMKEVDTAFKEAADSVTKYVKLVGSIKEKKDGSERRPLIQNARKTLETIEKALATRPNFEWALAGYARQRLDYDFFEFQRELLRDLERNE